MTIESTVLSLDNPVFAAYVLAASVMLLKLLLQPWMTVIRMMKVRAGFRSPEDAKQSPLNPAPVSGQLEPNEYVERSRRMNLNDLESIPAFLVAGLLFVLVGPPLLLAEVLFWTYVLARAAHFVAYATAQLHDVRATFWTFSSLSIIAMVLYTLYQVLTR
ncbi:MAPEG family protein [Gallaecimonas kandeliae]|uniref:MAPEG family protein n=1 Tax=Gallaecimonas kandeliae TaxID=3029055 RepID=UPI002648BCC3|nr:MAPEG family protein [Gallaecimonas kandeliae]WKE64042.1 MAPEG family protein [Gallaecimonas kandeliae]